MKQTASRKPALVFVNGELVEQFETVEIENEGIATGAAQAEAYIEQHKEEFNGKKVEILLKYKEFTFEEVRSVKMKEV